jgi:hypothetical protein
MFGLARLWRFVNWVRLRYTGLSAALARLRLFGWILSMEVILATIVACVGGEIRHWGE